MAEYIEREAFIAHIRNEAKGLRTKMPMDLVIEGVVNEVKQFPTADVSPVRHGRWIRHYEPYDTGEEWIEAPYGFECSECGRWEVEQEPFCNCGAKMEKEGE